MGRGLCLQVAWIARVKSTCMWLVLPLPMQASSLLPAKAAGPDWEQMEPVAPHTQPDRLQSPPVLCQAAAASPQAWAPLASSIILQTGSWSQPWGSQPTQPSSSPGWPS